MKTSNKITHWVGVALLFLFGLQASLWAQEAPTPTVEEKKYQEGVALMEKGDFDQALPLFEEIIQKDSNNAAAQYAAAVALARKKEPNTQESRKRHQEAVRLGYRYNEWLERYCDQLDKQRE